MTTTTTPMTEALPAFPRLLRDPGRAAPRRVVDAVAGLSSLVVLVTGVSLLATHWRQQLGGQDPVPGGGLTTVDPGVLALVLPVLGLAWMIATIWVARTRPATAAAMSLVALVPPATVGFVDAAWWGAVVATALVAGLGATRRSAVPFATSSVLALVGVVGAAISHGASRPTYLEIPGWLLASGGERHVVQDAVLGYVLPVVVVAVAILTVRVLLEAWAVRDTSIAAAARSEARSIDACQRSELARDLHDITAHHLSLVAVRAESLRYATPDLAESTRHELALVAEDARAALAEVRATLDVLSPVEHDAPLTPPPTAADLLVLVAGARDAGQRIDAHLPDDVEAVLARVDARSGQALYRISQECLSNARRHAPGEPVTLDLTEQDGALRLVVSNLADGVPGPARRGLAGVWTRAAQLGGTVGTETVDGRFVVDVTLPTTSPETL